MNMKIRLGGSLSIWKRENVTKKRYAMRETHIYTEKE